MLLPKAMGWLVLYWASGVSEMSQRLSDSCSACRQFLPIETASASRLRLMPCLDYPISPFIGAHTAAVLHCITAVPALRQNFAVPRRWGPQSAGFQQYHASAIADNMMWAAWSL